MPEQRKHLLFVGLATVDLIQRVAAFPTPDKKVQSDTVDVAAGGPAANAAITAAALRGPRSDAGMDYDVTLVSAVGTHSLAALIKADLAAHGVTLLDATPDATEPPPVSAVTVLSSTGERTIVSRNAGSRDIPVPAGGLPEADLTLVDGHHRELAVAAARSANRLLVDAGSWRPVFTEIFPHAEVVACSGDFRHPGATCPDATCPTAGTTAMDRATATAIPAPHVVITHGPDPVRWFTTASPHREPTTPSIHVGIPEPTASASASGEVPVPSVTAVDTAGAGDAFHGALAVALLDGDRDLPAAITYASHIAAIRVSHAGPRAWLNHLP